MKRRTIISLVLLTMVYSGCSSSNKNILLKTNSKLQKMTSVKYHTEYKNYNPMTGELGKNYSAITFFDFNSVDSIIGVKYSFNSDQFDYGFNGSTSFYTNEEKKQVIYRPVASYYDLIGIQYLRLSIQNLRSLLPQFLEDSAVHIYQSTDTIIGKTDCYKFDIEIDEKVINIKGELVLKEGAQPNLTLFVSKKNYLPKLFIIYGNKSPMWEVSYDDFQLSIPIADSVFNYGEQNSDYVIYSSKEYRIVTKNEEKFKNNALIGKKATDWSLPAMEGDSVSLSKIEANLIMLEFWFPYCTGCVAAIPDINEIQKTYKNKGLKIYGIEFTKSDSIGLADYIAKWKIEWPTLFSGKEVALDYGVLAGPTFFLVNKEGKFVYKSTGFIKEELIEAIEENI
ncbi:MAG: TlpA family protein disulfide reductase [Cyclobacteriaceae bacterium]|nr:TlpA family protein disulfide reductase [Cyclobacteriaceae bacterium]